MRAKPFPLRPPLVQRFRSWSRRHAYSLLSSLGNLTRHPLASAMTVIVLAIALSLPAGLYTTLDNLQSVGQDWQRLDTLTVFLEPGRDADQAAALAADIEAWDEVHRVSGIDPDQALEALGREAGFGEAVAVLQDNPLPWVLEVAPQPLEETALYDLEQRLAARDDVDMVLIDLRWLRRLDSMLAVIRTVVQLLAVLFALAVLFVIGNTIRLDIENRREEIEVMALVGATDSFIRRPFLYAGLWYGLLGGVLAWLMVVVSLLILAGPVNRLAANYDSEFQLSMLEPWAAVLLVLGSGILGLLGAWLAVGRHLRRINLG